jgi:tellurite resistance protein TehA-like permease
MSDSDSTVRHRDTPDQDEENQKDSPNEENSSDPLKHVTWKDRVAHFTWPWFACTMSTGALAVVLGNTPNQFNGLMTIGKIFFLLDIAMFAAFTLIIATRFFLVPSKFLASLHHPTESLFFGSYWVTVALLMNCMQIYGIPSTGPWLVKASEILFYMYCGTVLIVGVLQYYLLFQLERLNVHDA